MKNPIHCEMLSAEPEELGRVLNKKLMPGMKKGRSISAARFFICDAR